MAAILQLLMAAASEDAPGDIVGGWEGTPFSISASPAASLGTVGFYEDFEAGSLPSGWSNNFASESYSGGDLVLNEDLGIPLYYRNDNYVTGVEKSRITLAFKVNSLGGLTAEYGVGVSFASINTFGYAHSMSGFFFLRSTSDVGKVCVQDAILGTVRAQSVSAIDVNVGDEYVLVVERDKLTLNVSIENLTTPATTSTSFSINPNNPSIAFPNASKVQITSIGSSVAIHSIRYEVLEKQHLNCIVVGDSITYGQAATSIANRYASLLNIPVGKMAVMGNGADGTPSLVAQIPEIVALAPKSVMLMEGGNDVLFAVPLSTTTGNIDTFCTAMHSAGIKVIHLCPTPRNTTDVVPLKENIRTRTTDFIILGTYDDMVNGSADLKIEYDSSDGLHPNDAGMIQMATVAINPVIAAKLPSLL